ncbi:MAG: glycosyltransferase family 39 protein [Deltaproteobacteria bacterium]|nr:glycosyltransferase family 39 protein [Deltaproteobacteria bacterium]
MALLLVAAYLCLVNLDYAALWHDEAPAAFFGKTLLQQGSTVGWDGRNLVGGTNGRMLNEELRDVLPPLMYVLNAAGFAMFGINETGARVVHALMGIVALGVFFLLLRQHLPNHPRPRLLVFAFVALSPQLLLYFRQSRYYSVMVLTLVLVFYLYERYWRSRHPAYLAAVTVVAALSFFNHYAGGAAAMLSLAAYHALFRARETTRREWALFAFGGAAVVAAGAAYLYWLGAVGGERSGFMGFAGQAPEPYLGDSPALVIFFERIWIYVRELFTADWISWPVFLWFAGAVLLAWQARRKQAVGASRRRADDDASVSRGMSGDDFPLAATGRIVLFGALFALCSAMLSVQPIWLNPVADLRYYVGALPLLLAMKGLFAEWLWRKSALAGAAVAAVLLFSSAGAWPFNVTNLFTGERTLGFHLFQLVREVHRPYRDSIRAVSDYLLAHAEQDDLVHVPGFADREALIFTTGHRVLFCCMLDENSPLPRARIEALNAPYLRLGARLPDWIVGFGRLRNDYWERVRAGYDVAAELDVHPYPTQRPEVNWHAFAPLPVKRGVFILRRKE